MDFAPLVERFGDAGSAALIGAALGAGFGFAAQRSRFCLRSAASELAAGRAGSALSVWLCAFGVAVFATQYLVSTSNIETTMIRQLSGPGSLSGAIIGGLLFGVGMVLARGCSSRHLVLAAGGNLRALFVFILFSVTALATISGPLTGWGREISGLWRLSAEKSEVLSIFGASPVGGMILGAVILAAALVLGAMNRNSALRLAGGATVGLLAAMGWALTSIISTVTFEPTQVESISFTAPAANVVTYIASAGGSPLSFDIGFIAAVIVGAVIASVAFGEFKLQWFNSLSSATGYSLGAVLMGFGGVIAFGCAVGNLTTASIMSTTAWVALAAIWVGATLAVKAQQYLPIDLPVHAYSRSLRTNSTDEVAASV